MSRPENRYDQLSELSDEELMSQLQAGTVEAFDLLVERYKDPLSNYLYRFVGDWDEVEDLIQETFIRVFRNRHGYTEIASFKTWLYTIGGNLARTEYRRQKRWQKDPIHTTNREGEEYVRPLPSQETGPDEHAAGKVQEKHLQNALQELDPRYREAVVLRDIQQLEYKEISEITGVPLGTVKSRIHRGRSELQRLLEDVYP